MNISQKPIDELTAMISIRLQPADYQQRVGEVVKRYAKTANIPGFRPGHVPIGMIRKQYGPSILLDELNKLVSEQLGKYIFDNKIEIIGTPLPRRGEEELVLEDGRDFEFLYEIALAPRFSVTMPAVKLPYYAVEVDAKMVEDDINDLRRRYGKFSNPEVSEETSVLYGEFNELDESGAIKEGGVKTVTTLALDRITDTKDRQRFVGLKKEDTIDWNPWNVIGNETEVSAMLKIGKDNAAMRSDYRFTVMTISKIEKADMDQALFDKLYGEGQVTDENAFREKVKENIAAYFERESDRKFQKDIRNSLLESIDIQLPDEFLKRMLKANQEKQVDDHEFEHQYFHLAEDLRWNLIVGRIAEEQGITQTEEEVRELSRGIMRQQFAQYGIYDMDDARLAEMSERYLAQEGAWEKLERSLRESKAYGYLKGAVGLDRIYLPYDEFVARMNERTAHEVEHHH